MNGLKEWVVSSREQQRRAPERYLAHYPELVMDDRNVLMSKDLLEQIEAKCGRYDGTIPTGGYLGKMFLRGPYLMWFGIDRENPMTHSVLKSRYVILVPE